MDDNTLTIESALLGDIPGIVEFVVEWLQRNGLDRYVFAYETAVDEASTNVVKYAYGGKGGFFQISCALRGADIIVAIRDRGNRFDPNSVPLPEVVSQLEDRKVGGLGIYMMKKMMDRVDYSYSDREGNRLELVKKTTA
ncbi:MAG: ATP-binding protein [Chloroflexi bacterium]|jgi:anti-sigma regulatory factor (Ser/Thr protein kinase)|nr:ATP-binding protein [Chloroflexota bacterium]